MAENFNPYQTPPASQPARASILNDRFEKKPLTVFDWTGAIIKGLFVCGGSFLVTCAGLLPSAGIFYNGWVLVPLLLICVVFSIASGISSTLKQIHRCSYHGPVIYQSWLEELLFNISIGLITLMVSLPVTGFASLIMLRNNLLDDLDALARFPFIGFLIAVAVSALVAWSCWQPMFPKQKPRQRSEK